jgi:hypothetical protein
LRESTPTFDDALSSVCETSAGETPRA